MESLVCYKQLLLRRHAQQLGTARESLTHECLRLLSDLQEIDPSRRRRYEDLGKLSDILSLLNWVLTTPYEQPLE